MSDQDKSYDERLRQEAASWSAENAPTGLKTCPNCKLRKPAGEYLRANGADYHECTAEVALPAFAIFGEPRRAPINLGHFDPAAPYAERFNTMSCPLFRGHQS